MVNKKGIGYSIELIIAIIVIFTFLVGAMEFHEPKDYSEYRISSTTNDIAYISNSLNQIEESTIRGNTGNLETFIYTVTDRDFTISGTLRGLPFQNLIRIGFYTEEVIEDTQDYEYVNTGDRCWDNLEDILVHHTGSQDEILKTSGSFEDKYGVRLYLARTADDENYDYDAVFTDTGEECDFDRNDGPHQVGDIFRWGDTENDNPISHYRLHEGGNSATDKPVLHNATQVKRFKRSFNQPVNNVNVPTSISTFSDGDRFDNYDLIVLRDRIYPDQDQLESNLKNSSALFLENLDSDDQGVLTLLDDEDYDWHGSTSDQEQASFNQGWASREVRDYYMAMDNDDYVSLSPGGDIEVYQQSQKSIVDGKFTSRALVNHWTATEGDDAEINRIARTGYQEYPDYSQNQIDFLVALSYWLTDEPEKFNEDIIGESEATTPIVGVEGENKRVPYRLILRWVN